MSVVIISIPSYLPGGAWVKNLHSLLFYDVVVCFTRDEKKEGYTGTEEGLFDSLDYPKIANTRRGANAPSPHGYK